MGRAEEYHWWPAMANFVQKFPKAFWRMNLASLFFFLAFSILLPELPDFLKSLHGEKYLGFIVISFSISAILARPISGWITDVYGRKATMLIGATVATLAPMLYPLLTPPSAFILIRTFHGLSAGFGPTGFTAYSTDIIKPENRGEALGWQGFFNNVGTALGYACGSLLLLFLGQWGFFLTASCMGILAIVIIIKLPEIYQKPPHRKLVFKLSELIFWPAWKPSLLMLLICIPLGIMLTILPVLTVSKGFSNKGIYMFIYIASSLLIRIFSGRLSDAWGRPAMIVLGSIAQLLSMFFLLFGNTNFTFFSSAICYGFGQGFNAPSLFAWAGDASQSHNRGKSLSTLLIALELGIIGGGIFVQQYFQNQIDNIPKLLWVNVCASAIVFILALYWWKKGRKTQSESLNEIPTELQ